MRDIPKGDNLDYLRDPEFHIGRYQAFADSIGMRHELMGQEGFPIGEHSPFHAKELINVIHNPIDSPDYLSHVRYRFSKLGPFEMHAPNEGDLSTSHYYGLINADNELHDRGPTLVNATFNQHPRLSFNPNSVARLNIFNTIHSFDQHKSGERVNDSVSRHGYRHIPESGPSVIPIEPFGLSGINKKLQEAQHIQGNYFRTRRNPSVDVTKLTDLIKNSPRRMRLQKDAPHLFSPQFLMVHQRSYNSSDEHNDIIDLNTGTWAKD